MRSIATNFLRCALIAASVLAHPVVTAASSLDPTFGDGGLVFAPIDQVNANPRAIGVDATGKLLVAGYSQPSAYFVSILLRFSDMGSWDSGFGTRGKMQLFGDYPSESASVAFDSQNRAVIGGYVVLPITCEGSPQTTYLTVSRLKGPSDPQYGQLDSDFASGSLTAGTAFYHVGGCKSAPAGATAVSLSSDDSVVLVGAAAANDGSSNTVATILRWDSSGNADLGFGSGGSLIFSYPGANYTLGEAVAVDQFDRIVALFSVGLPDRDLYVVARFTKSGTPDVTFGNAGQVDVLSDNYSTLCCLRVDSSGRVVVAGQTSSDGRASQALFVRFKSSGQSDTSFGTNGKVALKIGDRYDTIHGMVLDKIGRPIATGSSSQSINELVTLIHLNVDGTLNAAVGSNGTFEVPLGFGTSAAGQAVAIDGLGRPTIAGYGTDRDGGVPVLLRYDEIFGDGFD